MTGNTVEIQHYIGQAIRTDLSPDQYAEASKRMAEIVRLEHACHGIVTEGAEIVDNLKRHIFYGKAIDPINLKEEVGDLMWYVALLMDELKARYGIEALSILQSNTHKLALRYPEKFDEQKALNRDLDSERQTLENGTP